MFNGPRWTSTLNIGCEIVLASSNGAGKPVIMVPVEFRSLSSAPARAESRSFYVGVVTASIKALSYFCCVAIRGE